MSVFLLSDTNVCAFLLNNYVNDLGIAIEK